jgi:hypothetical protein
MGKKTAKGGQIQGRPILQMAVFCERILEEADGVISVMRIVDKVVVSTDKDEFQPGVIELGVVVAFKSGDAAGKFHLELVGREPTGKVTFKVVSDLELKGGGHGSRIAKRIPIPVTMVGLYWVDVLLDSRRVTRMPLEILYQKRTPPEVLDLDRISAKKATKKSSRKKR